MLKLSLSPFFPHLSMVQPLYTGVIDSQDGYKPFISFEKLDKYTYKERKRERLVEIEGKRQRGEKDRKKHSYKL